MRSQTGLFAAGDPDAGNAFALIDGTRKNLLVSLVAAPNSHTLQREGNPAPCWLSRGTEPIPELLGHLQMLLCWEHSTLLPAQHRLRGCAGTAGTGLHVAPTDVGTCRILASVDVGEAALPHPGRLALVQVSLGILLPAL